MNTDGATETLKASGPAAYTIAWVTGMTIDQWISVLTLLWLIWLFADKIYARFVKPMLEKRRGRRRSHR